MDVALKTGVHPSLISRLENGDGRPGLDGLIRIARFYGVNVEDLVEVAYGKQDAEPAAEGAQ